ncbi:MAG: hypothetical protein JSW67_15560 [Candidatus Latescibacterota bacterium]|nr:MAG: hypothetical protein JSW67_15560 [Candidatus Latescibacterota bacterium]
MRRVATRGLALAALISSGLFHAPGRAAASDLSEVAEEAKKPVESQGVVDRSSNDADDCGSGVWGLVSLLLDLSACSDCSEPAPSPGGGEIDASGSHSRSQRRGIDSWYVGLKSLHLRPADDVLAGLGGAGIEAGFLSSSVRTEVGLYWLEGSILEDSPVYGGLADPVEVAIDGRVRVYFSRSLGVNGFVGGRFGRLLWEYVNPVFAVDEYGYGDEIWRDSLDSVSGYFGIGLHPFRTQAVEVGVDLGIGWRGYMGETQEGFRNDLFQDGWFPQIGVEVALHF